MKAFFVWSVVGLFGLMTAGSLYSQSATDEATPAPLETDNVNAPLASKPDYMPLYAPPSDGTPTPTPSPVPPTPTPTPGPAWPIWTPAPTVAPTSTPKSNKGKNSGSQSNSAEDDAIIRPPSLENDKAKTNPTPDDEDIIKKADELIRNARARADGQKSIANGAGEKVSGSLKAKILGQMKLAQQITDAIAKDPGLSKKASEVRALPQDGVITLNGTVNTVKEKVDIEDKASKIAGNEKVISEIIISEGN